MPVPRTIYGWIYLILMALIGVGLLAVQGWAWKSAGALVLLQLVFCWVYCSVPEMNLAQALGAMGAELCSGCANFTILYIWLPLSDYYLFALGATLGGIFKG